MAYTVRPRENLTVIANRFGTTVDELVRLNNISNRDLIFEGQELILPEGTAETPAGPPDTAPLPRIPPGRSAAAAMFDVGMDVPAPDGPEMDPAGGEPQPTGPTIGARPVPRPQSVQARDSMPAPIPMSVPGRPGVPGPPIDRGAPMEAGGEPYPGYQPAGWNPVPGGAADLPPPEKPTSPVAGAMMAAGGVDPLKGIPRDAWQGPQGAAYTSQTQRRGPIAMTNNDIPDFTDMSLQEMLDFEIAWMSAGRRVAELGPDFERMKRMKRQQMEAGGIAAGLDPANNWAPRTAGPGV